LSRAARLGGAADRRRAAAAELSGRGDADIVAGLKAESGYTDLGRLDAQRAEHVAAAYRHDCLSAHEYLAAALESPPAERLACPLTVVVAADDPYTQAAAQRYHEWERLAERVELDELADGGHHFLRTRSADAAALVVRTAGLPTSSCPATSFLIPTFKEAPDVVLSRLRPGGSPPERSTPAVARRLRGRRDLGRRAPGRSARPGR